MKCYAYTDESGISGLKLFGDAHARNRIGIHPRQESPPT